jgi:hypothetical protein
MMVSDYAFLPQTNKQTISVLRTHYSNAIFLIKQLLFEDIL